MQPLPCKDADLEIYWRKMTSDDFESMKEMFLDEFILSEPLSVALGISREDALAGFVDHSRVCIADTYSVCAIDKKKNIMCGMFINSGPHTAQKSSNNWGEGLVLPLKTAQLFRTLDFMSKGPEKAVATKAGNSKYLKGEYLMVRRDYLRLGLGKALCEKSYEVAREAECKYFFAECTSTYTTEILKGSGAILLKKIQYSEYTDKLSGEKVLVNYPEPHSSGSLMCLAL